MRPIFREDEPTTAGGTAPEIVAARRPDDERGMVMDKGTWWVADQNQKPEEKDGLKKTYMVGRHQPARAARQLRRPLEALGPLRGARAEG